MRIIAVIPHERIKISVFQMNARYILKMELGSFEQTYKLAEDEVNSPEDLQIICNEQFMDTVVKRFISMYEDFDISLRKLNQNSGS
jgi:hypothetical protein